VYTCCDVGDLQAGLLDFENETIEKQREELRLLIAELQDRDRELNEMVTAHQRQMDAWQLDRRRTASLEDKCSRLQSQSYIRICIFNIYPHDC